MDITTITLDELIAMATEAREEFGGDKKVVFTSNYGDRCRTQQAHEIHGRFEEAQLVKSGYSDSGYAVADDEEEMEADYNTNGVLVIK